MKEYVATFNNDDIRVLATVSDNIGNAVDLHLEYLKYYDSRGAGVTFGAYDPYRSIDMAEMMRITCIKSGKPSNEDPSIDSNIHALAELLRKAADAIDECGIIQEG